jgi:hypothetical protein
MLLLAGFIVRTITDVPFTGDLKERCVASTTVTATVGR